MQERMGEDRPSGRWPKEHRVSTDLESISHGWGQEIKGDPGESKGVERGVFIWNDVRLELVN